MIKEHLKVGNMKSYNTSSAKDIVYLDHSNSASGFGCVQDSTMSDNLSAYIKNQTIVIKQTIPMPNIEKEKELSLKLESQPKP